MSCRQFLTFRHVASLLCLSFGGVFVWRHTGGFDGWADVVGHAIPFLAGLALALPPKTVERIVAALPFARKPTSGDAA